MARILLWSLVFNLTTAISNETNCNGLMKDYSFQCRYKHVNTILNLECENSIQNSDSPRYKYILLELSREEDKKPLVNFSAFFATNFLSNSSIYYCDGIVPHYKDPYVLKNNCENITSCIHQAFHFLKATDVKAVELIDISNQSRAVQTPFSVFPSLEELRIRHVPSYNLSETDGNLKSLILTENNISVLPENLLRESSSLEEVNLAKNDIVRINELGYLPSLKRLNLSANHIRSILGTAFSTAANLEQLYLISNELTTLDEDLFFVHDRLEILDLSKNNIGELPEKIFRNLKKLKEFRCTECKLNSISQQLLAISTELSQLHLSRNEIKYLPPEVFQNHDSLKTVDLSYNKLFDIPTFQTPGLRFLYLANNEIRSIGSNLSANSPHLLVLDLSFNRVERLVDDHVASFYDMEFLDLRHNRVTAVELGEKGKVPIRKLILSNNSIRFFRVAWKKLEILELMEVDNNEIVYLDLPPCIDSVKQTITFSFRNNKITRVGIESLLEDERKAEAGDRSMLAGCYFNGMSKNFIDLSSNAFHCDCALYPFYEYLKKRSARKLDTVLNEESLKCLTPEVLRSVSVASLPEDAFTCPVEGCCPPPCRCGVRGSDGRIFVNCTGSGLESVSRDSHPPEATVLYLNRNSLSNLGSLNDPFWSNLTELHVDDNLLTSLDDWKAVPDTLRYLSVRGNDIRTLPEWITALNASSPFRLYLGDNTDKRCDCGWKALKEFLATHADLVPDGDEVTCEVDHNSTLLTPLRAVPDNVLCLPSADDALLAALCGSLALLVGLVLLYYKNRPLVLSFLYERCGCFEGEEAAGEVEFDAFVAYSSRDRDIVLQLLEELEPRFRLCVHERDWLPGLFIAENIARSVRGSSRTIAVLSEAFVASPWLAVELRAAAGRLIVVLADPDTCLDGLEADLRPLVTKRTYLVWGERWFWQKLRYAMPRRSCQEDAHDGAESGDDVRLIEASIC